MGLLVIGGIIPHKINKSETHTLDQTTSCIDEDGVLRVLQVETLIAVVISQRRNFFEVPKMI